MTIINWTNVTDFGQFPALANTASNGLFWNGMLTMVFVVLMILFLGYGFEVALIVPALLCMITSILMLYAGLVTWVTPAFYMAVVLFMIMYIVWSGSKK